MAGIVFLSTRALGDIVGFYTSRMGMTKWLDQGDCVILRHEDLTLGFCEREHTDACGVITFWYHRKEDVDSRYEDLKDLAEGAPRMNEKYRIYHFFLKDPEGRRLEVQKFLDL